MASEQPSLITEYLQLSSKYVSEYGSKTILLMQVGAFFEMYGLKKADSLLNDVCQLCQLNTSDKKICVGKDVVVMAGFRDYTLDKYIAKITDGGYTAVVYVQEKNGKTITRVLDAIYSPGTYISCDTDSSPQITNNIMCVWLGGCTTPLKPPVSCSSIALAGGVRGAAAPARGRTGGGSPRMICGVSVVNIFTGKSHIFEYECPYYMNPTTFDELERCVSVFSPSEVVFISSLDTSTVNTIIQYAGIQCSAIHRVDSESEKAANCAKQTYSRHILTKLFGEEAYSVCSEFNDYAMATQSFCYLSNFIQEHSPGLVNKITIPSFNNMSTRMVLANHTLNQLNIIGGNMCVSTFMNKCRTPMGKRLFHEQITNPTFNEAWLECEYEAIEMFLANPHFIDLFRSQFTAVKDIEKMLRQLVLRKLYPTSIAHLYNSICIIQQIDVCLYENPEIRNYLCQGAAAPLRPPATQDFSKTITDDSIAFGGRAGGEAPASASALIAFLETNLNIELCKGVQSLQTFGQNIIRPGISPELDTMIERQNNNIKILDGIQSYFSKLLMKDESDVTEYIKKHETEKSCVSLQLTKKRATMCKNIINTDDSIINIHGATFRLSDVKFANVAANMDEIQIPILAAVTKDIYRLNDEIDIQIAIAYNQILSKLENNWYENIEMLCKYVARADVIQSKAHIARTYKYCKPEIHNDAEKSFVESEGLRHCLIEHIQTNELYVTNDLHVGSKSQDGILLYGTNAVGKTSLIRALGVSVILAQCGMYVPCSRFVYKPYTAIYSRILGNDNLFKGLSTFAVEMSELRIILKMADENSLVLGDEVCSGTETESALSIFVTALMQLYSKKVSFIFATHFHEIIKFDEIRKLDTMVLAHMTVTFDRENDCLIYDRKLKMGPGNRMYGLEVCKSLYLEEDFLTKAYDIRNKYFPENKGELSHSTSVYNAKKIRGFCEMCKAELAEETHHIAQQKDATEDGFIGSFHKNHPANLMSVCEKCHDQIHAEPDTKIRRKKTTKGYKLSA
jgi:DNA mismatch repair protein MutS